MISIVIIIIIVVIIVAIMIIMIINFIIIIIIIIIIIKLQEIIDADIDECSLEMYIIAYPHKMCSKQDSSIASIFMFRKLGKLIGECQPGSFNVYKRVRSYFAT